MFVFCCLLLCFVVFCCVLLSFVVFCCVLLSFVVFCCCCCQYCYISIVIIIVILIIVIRMTLQSVAKWADGDGGIRNAFFWHPACLWSLPGMPKHAETVKTRDIIVHEVIEGDSTWGCVFTCCSHHVFQASLLRDVTHSSLQFPMYVPGPNWWSYLVVAGGQVGCRLEVPSPKKDIKWPVCKPVFKPFVNIRGK